MKKHITEKEATEQLLDLGCEVEYVEAPSNDLKDGKWDGQTRLLLDDKGRIERLMAGHSNALLLTAGPGAGDGMNRWVCGCLRNWQATGSAIPSDSPLFPSEMRLKGLLALLPSTGCLSSVSHS
jgi:hypothetical protein